MASLNTYNSVLGTKNARHLIRRTTFVYTKTFVDQISLLTPSQALDLLLTVNPLNLSLPYDPLPEGSPDGFWTESTLLATSFQNQDRKASIVSGWWWYNAIKTPTMQYKLSHFFSTCFTVEKGNGAGSASEFYDYLRLLLFYSYGNYKTLAKKMSVNNSMLNYLSNTSNSKNAPNENYAREFLELFTIGKGEQIAPGNYTNYTEADIVHAARVLTGFRRQPNRSVVDSETGIPKGYNLFSSHHTSVKQFSAAFNNTAIQPALDGAGMDQELEGFVNMIFQQEATAKNICRKLYSYFVRSKISQEVENDIIVPLSQQLLDNDYEIVPVVRKLMESVHFYDLDDNNSTDEIIGGIIRSPIQQLSELCTYFQASVPDPTLNTTEFYITFWDSFVHSSFLKKANMILFDPDNVAGHQAYYQAPEYDKHWASASTLNARYKLGESLLDGKNRIEGNTDILCQIDITEFVRNSGSISVPDDPFILTSELCNALFAQEPEEARINFLMNTFLLQESPPSDWTALWGFYIQANFSSVVDLRLKALLTYILKAPESQMF